MSTINSEKAVFFAKENGKVIEYLISNQHEPILVDKPRVPYYVIYSNYKLDISVKIDYFIDCLSGCLHIGAFQVNFSCDSYNDFVDLYNQCVEIASSIKQSGIDDSIFGNNPRTAFLYRKKELICMEAHIFNMNASIYFIFLLGDKPNLLITSCSYFGSVDETIEQKFDYILSQYKSWAKLFNNKQVFSLPETNLFPSKMIVGTKIVEIKDHLSK